ncbi:MAG: transcriptional regulator, Spx/MgsR family [Clostridia bacterium]|jgi:arsenate reductase|nr:transcriptional regulator, Spx/MgsR family [Clostridia bacterium]
MKYLFIEYPKCSTCQKAKKWLDENNIMYEDRHIVTQNPTEEELRKWVSLSKLPIKKFFNSSGILYKEMNLKDKLQTMTMDEQIALLASNGMLVKRPLIIGEGIALVGFKIENWVQLK